MRAHLLDPTQGDARLDKALALGREIYRRYEAGEDCSASLEQLRVLSGQPIDVLDVSRAFGSIRPETFAREQLIAWNELPADLACEEMLEMIELICQGESDELQTGYWIACLRLNTGDERISDLICWPYEYSGEGGKTRMLPADILSAALKSGKNGRRMPQPEPLASAGGARSADRDL